MEMEKNAVVSSWTLLFVPCCILRRELLQSKLFTFLNFINGQKHFFFECLLLFGVPLSSRRLSKSPFNTL